MPNQTCESIHDKFKEFTRSEKKFYHKGEVHSFTISLGYAQYPQQAKNYDVLMHCADAALYEVKLRGKQGCAAYKDGFMDVSENLPGAFLIYKADPDDDELLFANHEMLHLCG